MLTRKIGGRGVTGHRRVEVKIWGDSGGGARSIGTCNAGKAGGILAFVTYVPIHAVLDIYVGSGGGRGASGGVAGAGATNGGLMTGGTGGANSQGLAAGGGGGAGSAVVDAATDTILGIAGGGSGGSSNTAMTASTAGAARSSGGSLTPSDAGGNTGSRNGANGASAANRSGGGGGGGAEGGIGGVAADASAAPQGGDGYLIASDVGADDWLTLRDTTAESGMTPVAGGTAGNGSDGTSGGVGRIEITDSTGTTVYSTAGAYTHTVR